MHEVDSIFFPRRTAAEVELIAISAEASPIESGSPSCSDSNIASGRTGQRKELLSVQRLVMRAPPCGMGGSVSLTTPPAQCTRRPRLRRLQRQRRPQRASRVPVGCFCPGGSYGACAVIRLSAFAPMPPAPSRLLIPGGACRILFLRLRNGLRGVFPAGDGEGYCSCVEKLLRIRRKITPPAGSPEVAFAARASVCCGRAVLPLSQYRRARRPPMLQMPFPFIGISLLSLHGCR